ncbi:hypothetical protein AAMO2058_000169500 [Amorphochlora amoebiformis]
MALPVGASHDFSYSNVKRTSSLSPSLKTANPTRKETKTPLCFNFWESNLGDSGVAKLCSRLLIDVSVTPSTLNLWGNSIGDRGCRELARVLSKDLGITDLKLWHNHITDKGAQILAEALQTNTSLTSLNLYANKIGQQGANELLTVLEKENQTLRVLDLTGCQVPPSLVKRIDSVLGRRIPLSLDSEVEAAKHRLDRSLSLPEPGASTELSGKGTREDLNDDTFYHGQGWGDKYKYSPPSTTPEHLLAVYNNDAKALKACIVNGKLTSLTDLYQDHTCLHKAADLGSVDIARVLIELKSPVDIPNSKGKTPLHLAAKEGHVALTALLLDNGANPCREDCFRRTPHDVAASSVSDLLSKAAARMRNLEALFLEACAGGNDKDIERLLVTDNVWVDARSKDGFTGMMLASQNGHRLAADVLIMHGADVNATEIDGWGALHYACREGHIAIVRLLVSCQADMNRADRDFFTALHAAAEVGRSDIVSVLVKAHAQVDLHDSERRTALHIACDNGGECGPDLVRVLVDSKASPNLKDHQGKTPLHWAAPFARHQAIEALLEANGDPLAKDERDYTPLHYAALEGNLSVVEVLIEAKAEPNAKAVDGKSPFHLVSESGYEEILVLLQEAKGSLDNADALKRTPLHFACLGGQDEIVSILLEEKADVSRRDMAGRNALHQAIVGGNEGCLEIILEMLGPDAEELAAVADNSGLTSHMLARQSENEEFSMVLEEFGILPLTLDTGSESKGGSPISSSPMSSPMGLPMGLTTVVEGSRRELQDFNREPQPEPKMQPIINIPPFIIAPDPKPTPTPSPVTVVPTATSSKSRSPTPSPKSPTSAPATLAAPSSPEDPLSPNATILVPGTAGVGSLSFSVLDGTASPGSTRRTGNTPRMPSEAKEMAKEGASGEGKEKGGGGSGSNLWEIPRSMFVGRKSEVLPSRHKKQNSWARRRQSAPIASLWQKRRRRINQRSVISPNAHHSRGQSGELFQAGPGSSALPGSIMGERYRSQSTNSKSPNRAKWKVRTLEEVDTRDPDIHRVWDKVCNPDDDTNWMLMSLKAGVLALELVGYGSGGLREFVSFLVRDKVMWGMVQVQVTLEAGALGNRNSIVFFTHVGEKVSAFARAKAAVRTPKVMRAFGGLRMHVQATSDAYGIDALGRELLRSSSENPAMYHFGPEQSIAVSELKAAEKKK